MEENERRLERQADSLKAVEQKIQERLRLERKNVNLKSAEQAIRDFLIKMALNILRTNEIFGDIKKAID